MRGCPPVRSWLFLLLLSAPLTGCSDSTQPNTEDLVGTYDLLSVQIVGQPALFPPAVEGTLELTETTFSLRVETVLPGVEDIDVNGTYEAQGGQWSQTSDGTTNVGSYELDGSELMIDTVLNEQNIITVWEKRG